MVCEVCGGIGFGFKIMGEVAVHELCVVGLVGIDVVEVAECIVECLVVDGEAEERGEEWELVFGGLVGVVGCVVFVDELRELVGGEVVCEFDGVCVVVGIVELVGECV